MTLFAACADLLQLNWSFPRVDVSREVQSRQLALALRDEVVDLEKAGIFAIQGAWCDLVDSSCACRIRPSALHCCRETHLTRPVDEPAIREGLPLRRADWDAYLTWAVDSFRLSTAGVEDKTQTHSHLSVLALSSAHR